MNPLCETCLEVITELRVISTNKSARKKIENLVSKLENALESYLKVREEFRKRFSTSDPEDRNRERAIRNVVVAKLVDGISTAALKRSVLVDKSKIKRVGVS